MSFFLPIAESDGSPPAATFPLAFSMSAAGSVVQRGGGTLRLSFGMSMFDPVRAQIAFGMTAAGHVDGEPNLFGGASFGVAFGASISGAVAFHQTVVLGLSLGMSIAGATEEADEFGFTFIVDIVGGAIAALRDANTRSFSPRLLVNGAAVPIVSATLDAPEDTLGTQLTVVLARPNVAQVPTDAAFDFDLGYWNGSDYTYVRKLSAGRLNERSQRLLNSNNLPADTVKVTIIDVVADRLNRRPPAQTLLYDPVKVEPPTPASLAEQTIRTRQGATIEPVITPRPNMRLYDVMEAAYIEGCGFDAFQTNIENFPVEEATFSLSGGYDAGVRPLLRPFSPAAFPIDNTIWVVDPDAPLPAGLTPREYALKNHRDLDDTLPGHEPINALLVRVRDEDSGDYFTERVETERTESGAFGEADFTETVVERRVREYRNVAAPTTIVREQVTSTKTTVSDSQFNIISRETETDSFDVFQRKTGHDRTVEMTLPDLTNDGALLLQTVQREKQQIVYAPHPLKPTKDTQSRVETRIEGLILVDEGKEYLGEPYRIPYLDAHRSGYIDPDGDQHTEFGPVRSVFEYLRVRGEQVQVEVRSVNHLTNAPDRTTVTTRPGATEVDRNAARYRTVLVTLEEADSTPRRAEEFDGSNLPPDLAFRLAERQLKRRQSKRLSGELVYADPAIRRGTLMRLRDRVGSLLGDYIVLAHTTVIQRTEAGNVEALMSVRCRQTTG